MEGCRTHPTLKHCQTPFLACGHGYRLRFLRDGGPCLPRLCGQRAPGNAGPSAEPSCPR